MTTVFESLNALAIALTLLAFAIALFIFARTQVIMLQLVGQLHAAQPNTEFSASSVEEGPKSKPMPDPGMLGYSEDDLLAAARASRGQGEVITADENEQVREEDLEPVPGGGSGYGA